MQTKADASVAGLILAAGSSTRMGRPKQLLPFHGRPLLQHTIDAAQAGGIREIVLVLGHQAKAVLAALHMPPGSRTVMNPDHRRGQASSLRAGLEALPKAVEAAVVLLGDQPEIHPDVVRAAIETYRRTGGPVVRTEYRGLPGHPVVLGREVWSEVTRLSGDTGARPALERHPEWIVPLPVDQAVPVEVDTPDDYRALIDDSREA